MEKERVRAGRRRRRRRRRRRCAGGGLRIMLGCGCSQGAAGGRAGWVGGLMGRLTAPSRMEQDTVLDVLPTQALLRVRVWVSMRSEDEEWVVYAAMLP